MRNLQYVIEKLKSVHKKNQYYLAEKTQDKARETDYFVMKRLAYELMYDSG